MKRFSAILAFFAVLLLLAGCGPQFARSTHMTLSSGAGAWSTELELFADGTFTGEFHDTDMGDADPDYPHGTVYLCDFYGSFTDFSEVDPNCWSMSLEELEQSHPEEVVWLEDGTRFVSAGPYGLEDGTEFLFYGVNTPVDSLPEDLLSWWPGRWEETPPETLNCFCLYNTAQGTAFFTPLEQS